MIPDPLSLSLQGFLKKKQRSAPLVSELFLALCAAPSVLSVSLPFYETEDRNASAEKTNVANFAARAFRRVAVTPLRQIIRRTGPGGEEECPAPSDRVQDPSVC